jgi:protein ImuB
MSNGLYLCAWVAEFPAQALLRLHTDWQTEAVVIMDGRAPQEWVCSLNRLAEQKGAATGMTRLEVESIRGMRLLKRSAESEAAARAVFLECVAKFSPRIEDAMPGTDDARSRANSPGTSQGTSCALVLDIAGTERLFGSPQRLAERLRDALAEAGFRASIAVSANYDTARLKAAGIRGIAVIPKGGEAETLAKLPIAALGMDEEHEGTFALWGIRTLGELSALPETDLVARMGPEVRRWRALANGTAEHAFVPIELDLALEEFCEFETPVEQIDSLLFVGARMIDCLVTRASGRALALAQLRAEMRLERAATHCVTIRPALPSTDRKFLLKLLQLEIGVDPPQAAVVALTLRAEAGQASKVQLGLFTPQTPEPSRLDVTLARLRALIGEDRVGSPVLDDTHRAGGFHMEGFANPGLKKEAQGKLNGKSSSCPGQAELGCGAHVQNARMALRRVRPAREVRVLVSPNQADGSIRNVRAILRPRAGTRGTQVSVLKPVSFRDGEQSYVVAAAYGPWRTSGCWWALNAWDTEEWDVLAVCVEKLPSGAKAPALPGETARLKSCPFKTFDSPVQSGEATIACLLVHDRARNDWRLEAFYD